MLAYWEREALFSTPRTENPPLISCLSWTGADIDGNRGESGWLAIGNTYGEIGITSTSTVHHSKAMIASYNLQNIHQYEISFVRFNKQKDYLASCDKRGILCVWGFSKKRWICKCKFDALGNMNSRVTDLIWSHKGLCLISHPGGVVSIFHPDTGRAATYPLGFGTGSSQARVTISPCNGIIYVGTDRGELKIVDLTGVATYRLRQVECSVLHMCCSQKHTLAIGFMDGIVILVRNEDKESFVYKELNTKFDIYCLEWSEFSNYLAILGVRQERTHLHLYNLDGALLLNLTVSESINTSTQKQLAIAWGHSDQRVFVTNGVDVAVVRVVADNLTSLMEMSSINIYEHGSKSTIMLSALPPSTKLMLTNFMTNTIYDPISGNCASLKDFHTQMIEVATGCLYCTVKYSEEDQVYTLYLERMGSLVPLLEARQVGLIRPKFVICDRLSTKENTSRMLHLGQVVSNILGTKFKVLGAGVKKKCLVKVQYKTSLIRWVPRRMKVIMPNPKAVKRVNVGNIKKQPIAEDNVYKDENIEKAHVKMHNCSPQWNSEICVYQLDCGGRVMLESEKNFRFDYIGLQALQFGRIGDHSYTLDFGYPFSAIQAFGIALSSLTHRLK